MSNLSRINDIRKNAEGYWGGRILAQLDYALKVSKVNGKLPDPSIERAVTYLEERVKFEGTITKPVAIEAEKILQNISAEAKKYTVICAAHAHIDMNWMWDYAETAAITLETFRTMLDLMDEYPQFRFSQSQASVYRIVEELDPDMLEEIRKRVAEGRWEVTASTWVEADKNMPGGESHARHLLYTKRYLKELLGLRDGDFTIDYEPDTFGHNGNVPEILSKAGVRYHYHCRGYEGHHIYNWESLSGAKVLSFREPVWYNLEITPGFVMHIPEFCDKYGLESMLYVYGVGDHGGGPTRRDLERLIDMQGWPVFPEIKFGTYREFFEMLEKKRESFPVVKGELNSVFTGCYTSQSRIKKSNRLMERRLYGAESANSMSMTAKAWGQVSNTYGGQVCRDYEKAWRRVLFNQFHDILPGSGTIDTREYAMGEYQKSFAEANTWLVRDLRKMAGMIDSSGLAADEGTFNESKSEGAGVGFGMEDKNPPRTERGRGKRRIYHVFNTTPYDSIQNVAITIWDWPGDTEYMHFTDSGGNGLNHDLEESGKGHYWGHDYIKALVCVKIPAFGYETIVADERAAEDMMVSFPDWPRLEDRPPLVLENEQVRVGFDDRMRVVSYFDKVRGTELADPNRPSGFIYAEEQDEQQMSSWITGRYKKNLDPPGDVKVVAVERGENLARQKIIFEYDFMNSKIKAEAYLDSHARGISYDVECDWREIAKKGYSIPRLEFDFNLGYSCEDYAYDMPFGVIRRKADGLEAPANSFIAAMHKTAGTSLMLWSDSKYGYRGDADCIAVSLLRSSCDPDPYPEFGIHRFSLHIGLVEGLENCQLIERAALLNNPAEYVPGTFHKGVLKTANSLMSIKKGNIGIESVKPAEYEKGAIVLRAYETEGKTGEASIEFATKPQAAYPADMHENRTEGQVRIEGGSVTFGIEAYSIATVVVSF